MFKLGLQAAYFVLLARVLGVELFGSFAAIVAIAAIGAPFSNIGANLIMAKSVARDPQSASAEWSRTVVYTLVGGCLLTGVSLLIAPWILPNVHPGTVAAIVFADIVAVKLVENVGYLYQALGSVAKMAVLPSLINLFRVIAVLGAYFFSDDRSLQLWAVCYFLATVPFAAVCTIAVSRSIGFESSRLAPTRKVALTGLQYSFGLSSQSVHNDVDKTLLAGMVSASSAGIYSAAYRFVDMAYAPVRAVAAASFPRLNRAGEEGISGSLRVVRRLAVPVLCYSAFGALVLVISAPYAVALLGPDFEQSTDATRVLAILLLLRALSFLAGDALTTSDNQGARTLVQIIVGALGVAANIVFIPAYGMMGAIVVTLCSEFVLAACFWVVIFMILRREQMLAAEDQLREFS
jgi:O-antigen/teichoic acid export membrane protein